MDVEDTEVTAEELEALWPIILDLNTLGDNWYLHREETRKTVLKQNAAELKSWWRQVTSEDDDD